MNVDTPLPEPTPDQIREAEEIAAMIETSDDRADFQQMIDESLHPQLRVEREAREARQERLQTFVNGLIHVPSGYELPEGFEALWDELLATYEEREKERLATDRRTPEQLSKLVTRGWMTVDQDAWILRSHSVKPVPTEHPIPVVLVNDDGRSRAPAELLEFGLKLHPFVRAFTDQLQDSSPKDHILRKLQWASSGGDSDEHHAVLLAQAADGLDLMIYAELCGDPAEIGWLHEAQQTDRFWQILNAAIGFGRRLATHEIYGDGMVEELVQKALLNPGGRSPDRWGKVIERIIVAFTENSDGDPTPSNLLVWIGGEHGKSDTDPLTFGETEYARDLAGINWDQFQNRVKAAKRRLGF